MCQFKSGIILKNRCVVARGADDSHRILLEGLGIEDSAENALRVFVRAELLPPNNEWWTDPDTWDAKVDQDIVPEWFSLDREKYLEVFRSEVKAWWKGHVLVGKKIDELSSGYYRLKHCEVKKLLEDVQVMCDSSTVKAMHGNSAVKEMYGNSAVQAMYDNSAVQEMYDNSAVKEMYDNSAVKEMYHSSTVKAMHGSSTVQEMHDNSIARDLGNGVIRVSAETKLQVIKHEDKAPKE